MAPHMDAPSPSGSLRSSLDGPRYNSLSFAPRQRALDGYRSSSESLTDGASTIADVHMYRPLIPGVYVPTMCFFEAKTEDVDTTTIAQHAVRLARAGVTGLATQGSNGEAVHLTHAERYTVTATTRRALNENGFSHLPIIVGCGSQSTKETIEYCREAYEAGGDYALVLPPSYYAGLFAPACETIIEYFHTVADSSPIPLLIYNFPGAVGGLDLSSDIIIKLSRHPNIVGVKLTCGNTGKLNRVVSATRRLTKLYDYDHPEFVVLGGSADFLVQTLAAGGHGILAGLANLAPKACLSTMRLYREGSMEEAQHLQDTLSDGDWTAIQGGVVGTKAGLQAWLGYAGYARSPLPKPTEEQAQKWKDGFKSLMELEKSLD
ncbi:dihydrodipicolinate synthetase [Emericellopsis atlantica]|uniref:Dihydrodipicolinate synthetase n=1 Tax=Emericellopsis atlantica TaxID=2614577 RepID=A0A9P8CKI2_9HYPO|nr:dihydrodipicolinate synthetase [Emericellopsis atlantica]KAG9249960.1 dihydrodipicolinate synthetase [Emericellopsis atlantica]